MSILAIDPGPRECALVLYNERAKKPESAAMVPSLDVRPQRAHLILLEQVESYGMRVGKSIFQTCEIIGRIRDRAERAGASVYLVPRREVKLALCGRASANDADIRRRLMDIYAERFSLQEDRQLKGTRAEPGPLYGIARDLWAALAIAEWWMLRKEEG